MDLIRLVAWHDNPFLQFVTHLSPERLCELLSILTDKPQEWVRENWSLSGAAAAIGEFAFADDNLAGDWLAHRLAGCFEQIKNVN
jgi:hypothetical protein